MEWENLHQSGSLNIALRTLAVLLLLVTGCAVGPTSDSQSRADATVFELKAITPERAADLLSQMGLGDISVLAESNSLAVCGPADVRQRAAVVLDVGQAGVLLDRVSAHGVGPDRTHQPTEVGQGVLVLPNGLWMFASDFANVFLRRLWTQTFATIMTPYDRATGAT